MLRNYEFRIYPSKRQQSIMTNWMAKCCELYNACLEQRKSAWRILKYRSPEARKGQLPNYISQTKALREIKLVRPEFNDPYAQVLLDPVARVQRAFDGFFARLKKRRATKLDKAKKDKTGKVVRRSKLGYPRFKSRDRYNTFAYSQHGFRLLPSCGARNGRLELAKIGSMPIRDWKDLPGQPKRVTIKQIAGKWFAVLCCELLDPAPLPPTGKVVGLDMGLTAIAIDSAGNRLGSLTRLKANELVLQEAQRSVSRKKKGSARRRKAKVRLQGAYARLARQRKYQLHQIANSVVARADLIGVEKLEIQKMTDKKRAPAMGSKAAQRGLHRNIHQAAWGNLIRILSYKAEEAGRQLVQVDPHGTSQACSACGQIVPKTLGVRRHVCSCGLDLDRDHNAAINILQRALRAPRGAERVIRPVRKRLVCRKSSKSCATSLSS